MRNILAAVAMTALAACGGGDDFIRSASRSCDGPFAGSLDRACSIELQLDGTEVIHVVITGKMVSTTNTLPTEALAARSLRVQIAGVSEGFQSLTVVAAPGEQGSATFTLRADLPAANLGGYPAQIGLGSFELLGDLTSAVVDVTVSADADGPLSSTVVPQ